MSARIYSSYKAGTAWGMPIVEITTHLGGKDNWEVLSTIFRSVGDHKLSKDAYEAAYKAQGQPAEPEPCFRCGEPVEGTGYVTHEDDERIFCSNDCASDQAADDSESYADAMVDAYLDRIDRGYGFID